MKATILGVSRGMQASAPVGTPPGGGGADFGAGGGTR